MEGTLSGDQYGIGSILGDVENVFLPVPVVAAAKSLKSTVWASGSFPNHLTVTDAGVIVLQVRIVYWGC